MPGFDGTGPMGSGPRTGRGFGPCGVQGFGFGRRRGFGGMGRSLGRFFGWRQPSKDDQQRDLSAYKKDLEAELEEIKEEEKRLAKEE